MRHVRFAIGEAERDAWLHHMREALDELGLDEAHDAQLWDYLVMAAHSLVNVEPARGHGDLGLTPALARIGADERSQAATRRGGIPRDDGALVGSAAR